MAIASAPWPPIRFVLDGRAVEVPDDGSSLLEALRDRLQVRSAKDGCSPQGQCGCCTVLVDGQARVAYDAHQARGRAWETTVEGLEDAGRWASAFTASGASQCGFCTPGTSCALPARRRRATLTPAAVDQGSAGFPPVPLHRLADDPGSGALGR